MRRVIPFFLAIAASLCVSFAAGVATIAELQEAVGRQGRSIQSFVLEGVVCAVVPEKSSVVVQDASATALLEIAGSERFRAGDRLQLRGDRCTVTRGRFGIQLGTAPVVDNDGAHAGLMKSGVTFLRPGRHPIRLLWFNRERPAVLKLEYEGAGLPRRSIPGSALWRKVEETDDGFLPGLRRLTQRYGIRCERPGDLDHAVKEMIDVDKPVLFDCVVDPKENCFPMIPSGRAHNEMILGDAAEKIGEAVTEKGKVMV